MNDHELRREHLLDNAQREGRIVGASRAHWSAQYDTDPKMTEQHLAMLTPVQIVSPGVLGHAAGDEVDRTLAAGRAALNLAASAPAATAEPASAPHLRPVANAAATGSEVVDPTVVTAWTRHLFPETVAGSGATQGRITRDGKYTRSGAAA